MNNLFNMEGLEHAVKAKQQIYQQPIELQNKLFSILIDNLSRTTFGKNHNIHANSTYTDFVKNVPVRDYADFNSYIDLITNNHDSVLWPGKPIFLGTTSATTGERKYIPVTKDSIATFIEMTQRIIAQYIYDEKDYTLLNGNMINFTGSTSFKSYNNFPTGSISSICRKMLPMDLADKTFPSEQALNKMVTDGWDAMFKLTAREVINKNISMCTGLPSWMMQFFKICCDEYNTQDLSKLFSSLRLLCTSGVNYKPYLPQLHRMFNNSLKIREMYGATEGAFAYQDSVDDSSMLLNLNGGTFFEFIDAEHAHLDNPMRISLADVKINKPYVPIISTNAGLWAYRMTDVIKFTSIKPYKICLLGRTTNYISIVAEHVYVQLVENVMYNISKEFNLAMTNFTVAPSLITNTNQSYYDWYMEITNFNSNNFDRDLLIFKIDYYLKQFSTGYSNARNAKLLGEPKVHFLKTGSFFNYLKQKDSSSLQLKVPKVTNDRIMADYLIKNDLIIKQENAYS